MVLEVGSHEVHDAGDEGNDAFLLFRAVDDVEDRRHELLEDRRSDPLSQEGRHSELTSASALSACTENFAR